MKATLRPALFTKEFILACLVGSLYATTLAMQVTTIPLYVKSFGGDDVAVGLVSGVPQFATMVSRLLSGWGVDYWGRKRILLVATIVLVITTLLLTVTRGVAPALAVRTVQSLAGSATFVVPSVLVVDLAPLSRRGEGLGYYTALLSLPVALAPAFGIWLIRTQGFFVDGYTLMFASSAAISAAAFLMSIFINEPKHQRLSATQKPLSALKLRNLVAFGALPAAIVMCLAAVPLGAMYAFLAIYAGGDGASLFFLSFATVSLLLRAFGGRLSDRFGRRRAAIPAMALIAIGVGVLALSTNIAVVLIAALLFGLGWGAVYPAVMALAADDAPGQRGAAIGTFNGAMDGGFMLAMISLGFVAQALGYPSVFLAAGFATFVGLLYLVAYRPRGHKQSLIEVA